MEDTKKITNKRHIKFVDLYLQKGYSATTAYMEIYPKASYSSARAMSSRLLTNVNIKALIEDVLRESSEMLGITLQTQLEQLEYLKSMLIQEGKYKDAVAPLEVQNKMLGLSAPDKIDITTDGESFNIKYVVPSAPVFTMSEETEEKKAIEDKETEEDLISNMTKAKKQQYLRAKALEEKKDK